MEGSIRILLRLRASGILIILQAAHPAIPIVRRGIAVQPDFSVAAIKKSPALGHRLRARGRIHVQLALLHARGAAFLENVEPNFRAFGDRHRDLGSQDHKRIAALHVGVKSCGALRQGKPRDAAATGKREVGKLQNGVFGDIGSGAVFEFHACPAIIGSDGVALLNGHVDQRGFPTFFIGVSDLDIALDHAQPDHARIAVVVRV